MTATHPIRFSSDRDRPATPSPSACAGRSTATCSSTARAAAATRPTPPSTRSSPWAWSCRARPRRRVTALQIAARGGRARPAARRRHLAVRPDGGRGAGHRRQQAPQPRGRGRRRPRDARSWSPGVVLDTSTRSCARTGCGFPVDVSTAAQATLGGMAGNNSCGSRSIAYGYMVHRVRAIDAVPRRRHARALRAGGGARRTRPSARCRNRRRRSGTREKDEIEARFPKVPRRVAGYNLDCLARRRARTSPSSWWAAKARWRGSSASRSTWPRSRSTRRWAWRTSRASTTRWTPPSTS